MTVLTCLPEPAAVDLVGDIDGVEFLVWDGTGDPPPGADRVEFLVARYPAGPPPGLELTVLPALRVVQLLSAGVEPWLPLVPPDLLLCNGRGVHGGSTAEIAIAGLLAVTRQLPRFVRQQEAGRWERAEGESLDGKQVLVIGAGDIADHVARVVTALDASATLVGRSARDGVRGMAELPELLPHHDAVVLAVPLTPQTSKLVDAGFLARMPDGAVLVNVSRGGVVDTDALVAETRTGRLRAYLDVTDPEPLPAGHPLWSIESVLITPHVGGGTLGWQRRAYRLVRVQLARYLAGESLLNVVDKA